jgi:hypothetical protein
MTRLAPPINVPGRVSPVMVSVPPTIADGSLRMSAVSRSESSRVAARSLSAPTAITAVIAGGRSTPGKSKPRFAEHTERHVAKRALPVSIALVSLLTIAAPSFIGDPERPLTLAAREAIDALTTPVEQSTHDPSANAQTAPTDAAAPDAAFHAPLPPLNESVAAVAQSEPESAVAEPPAEEGALPQRSETTAIPDSIVPRAPATSPTSDTPRAL